MAEGTYKLVKENSSGYFDEKGVLAESGKALGFDSSLNPVMLSVGGSTGGGLTIQSAIVVETVDNAKTNGAALIAAYTAAKALLPNGAALATNNRACVIIPPGKYDLDHGTENACVPLELDTEFVDIIGLTNDRSLQHIYGTPEATNSGVIVQTANDVHISNLTVEILTEVESAQWDDTDSGAYFPSTNLSSTVMNNVEFIGGDGNDGISPVLFGMRTYIEYSGIYNFCKVGYFGFGLNGIASGTFYQCTGSKSCFGTGGTASGTFTNCTGGENSFGAGGIASGTFNNCTGGSYSFGGYGTASGTFTNCTGGDNSFGAGGVASGNFNFCTGSQYSFGGNGGTASGTFTNCTGGDNSFGAGGVASGTFNYCNSGNDSFGTDGGIASGTFSFCKMNGAAFGTIVSSVASVEIASGGTNYEVDDELTVSGGIGTESTLKVTSVNAGVIDGIEILTVGAYTALPSNPVATTGHTGDATFNITWNEGHIYGCVDSTGFIAEKNWDDPA